MRRAAHGRAALSVVALTLLLAGCTLGPEPERPRTAADGAAQWVHGGEAVAAAPAAGEGSNPGVMPWWETFGDPATSELVALALAHNSDLRLAAGRVLEAEAGLRRARGARWPQADLSASGSKVKSSFVLPQQGRVSVEATSYSASLGVSWMVDLFGKLKRSNQAALAALLAEQAGAEAVEHAVVAQVVRARVLVASLERSLAIAHDLGASWEQTLATTERRYRSGLVTAVDVYLARENLSSARAAEVSLAAGVAQARNALDVLVGRRPGSGPELPDTLADLPDLAPVPAGLPAALLDRRPDLRQAEARLAAATYGVGAALADLYPSLTLSGSAGPISDSLNDLVASDAIVHNAVMSVLAPLFTGGQRRADVAAARARADQAAASYAGAVLAALREVEDALIASAATAERLELSRRRVAEARSADRLARDRYQRGVDPLLKVLETERRVRAAESDLLTTKSDLWNARIDLFLALGGDWRPAPVAATAAAPGQVAASPPAGRDAVAATTDSDGAAVPSPEVS